MLLYLLAYTCNLLATPLDDQLSYEARRDPTYYKLLLPAAFEARLGVWHALNLIRVMCCGLAWVMVCYRSNPFVMLKVFEARREQQVAETEAWQQQVPQVQQTGQAAAVQARSAAAGMAAHGVAAAGLSSTLVSRDDGSCHGQQQQQAWAVDRTLAAGGRHTVLRNSTRSAGADGGFG